VDPLAVVRARLAVQRLTGAPFASPGAAVAALGAVQGQEWAEAKWSLAERVAGATDASVEAAFARGEFLRTHVLRPTWHLVAPADLRWLQRLTAARVHARNAPYYRRHGLDDAVLARGDAVLAEALADGEPRTRAELREALAGAGIEGDGARLAHVLMHAELEALVGSGPRRGAQHTYVLLGARAPAAPERDRDGDLSALARRYVTGHGPATVRDLAWWSGLTMGDARGALELTGDALERRGDWYAPPGAFDLDPGLTGAHLVPMYDESTIAFRDVRIVRAGEGPVERPILVEGRTVGSWRRVRSAREVAIEATLLARLGRAGREALDAAVERYAAFLGRPVALRILTSRSRSTGSSRPG
jgi:Winged helix DNA-binding domain